MTRTSAYRAAVGTLHLFVVAIAVVVTVESHSHGHGRVLMLWGVDLGRDDRKVGYVSRSGLRRPFALRLGLRSVVWVVERK
jgi:hypothetical protein